MCHCSYIFGSVFEQFLKVLHRKQRSFCQALPHVQQKLSPVRSSVFLFDLRLFYIAAFFHYCPSVYSVVVSISFFVAVSEDLSLSCISAAFPAACCPMSLAFVQFLEGSVLMEHKASSTSE